MAIAAFFHCAALVSIQKKTTPALIKANIHGTEAVLKAVKAAEGPINHAIRDAIIWFKEQGML